jgi:hypothetical protein
MPKLPRTPSAERDELTAARMRVALLEPLFAEVPMVRLRSSAPILLGACVALVAPLVGGCATDASLARDYFVSDYTCPSDQVTVEPSSDGVVLARGCGHEAKYHCADVGRRHRACSRF